ncbi:MAG: alpha/beta fold hydrolase, partial [Gemmatimonadales bacterium]
LWSAVAARLARSARVLALDLAGFGHTPLAGRRAALEANRRLLDRFLDEVVGGPVVLMGNSMGGTLALLEAAAQPQRVAGLVLVCPSVPRPAGVALDRDVLRACAVAVVPGLAERVLYARRRRLGTDGMLREGLRLCCVDPASVPEPTRAAMFAYARERARMEWADDAYLQAARSLISLHTRGRRRFAERIARVRAPTLLIQGAADRLAPLAAAERLASERSEWTFAILDDIGHLPMLEAPDRFADLVEVWLNRLRPHARTL